jgi:hypothetical protein
MKTHIQNLFLSLALFVSLTQTGRATVAFTVTPAAVSNTYSGTITLVVTGLTNTETVVVQKYLDVNTNGVIDAGDILWQQFNLTDGQAGMVIGGVTNINVPGDTDGAANGSITAKLIFQFAQSPAAIAGNYLFKLSSPVGHFLPLTNSFTVTNFPFGQKFTGTVASNGVAVPNAGVLLFQGSGHDLNPIAGAVANNAGVYTITASAGTYLLAAIKGNYVADTTAAANLVLGGSATINTNLNLIATTETISGQIIDTNSGVGLPGILVPVQTKTGLLGISFTDTNGNFTAGVNASQWGIGTDSAGLAVHGYLGLQNKMGFDTTTGSVANVTIALSKATALFYGTVKDNGGNPLPGVVAIYAYDNNNNGNGLYQADGYTDTNGYYVTTAVGGLGGNDTWQLQVDNTSSFPNYIFSQPAFDQNGGTNLNAGQSVPVNFTAIPATNQITGNVKDSNGTNIAVVGVWASETINGAYYFQYVDTDTNGNYTMNVAGGTWSVGVECFGGSDSLSQLGNYDCPNNQSATIAGNNATNNFTVQFCGGVAITTTSPLPGGAVNTYYGIQFQGSSCSGNLNWSVNDPLDLPAGMTLYSGGAFNGTPTNSGTYNFSVNLNDGNGNSTNETFSLNIAGGSSGPLVITTTSLPDGTNGAAYSQTLQASGGQTPYSWSIPNYSADPPPNLTLATNGVLSGTFTTAGGPFYFDVQVTDGSANTAYQTLSVYIVNPPLPPLVITNVSLPNGTIGAVYSAQLGATGGQSPYSWQLAVGSANPPAGLTLNSSGLISGTPTTNKVSTFKVQATDENFVTTNKVLSITINAKPVLGSPTWLSNQFHMRLTGASNQNYTVQMSTDLSSTNWISMLITNNTTTNSFLLTDPNATNKQRFYRILIGP